MTCLNPVAKPSPAQGTDSTSLMAAGLHSCTTGEKTRASALLRVLEQGVIVAGSAPTCTIPLWRQPVPTEFLHTGYCGFHIRRAPARIWNARATVAFPYPASQMQLISATARSVAGDQGPQSWPERGPRIGRRRSSESRECRGFC
jgi:hypothetical protein